MASGWCLELVADGLHHRRVAMAEQEHAEAPAVEVGLPVAAVDLGAGGGSLDRGGHHPGQTGERLVDVVGVALQHQVAT